MEKFIVVSNDYERTQVFVEYIVKDFEKAGFQLVDSNPDFVLVLGGDGTFLDACKKITYNPEVVYIGINLGNLGYFLDVPQYMTSELIDYLKRTPKEKLSLEYYNLLEAEFILQDNQIIKSYAVNEIMFLGKRLSRLDLGIGTDNGFYQKVSTSHMIVSTSAGSTGINKSNFGPVMLAEYPLLIMSFNLAISNNKTGNFITNPLVYSSFSIDIINNFGNFEITLDNKEIPEIKDVREIKRVNLRISDRKIQKLNFLNQKRGTMIRGKMIKA